MTSDARRPCALPVRHTGAGGCHQACNRALHSTCLKRGTSLIAHLHACHILHVSGLDNRKLPATPDPRCRHQGALA